MENELAVIKDMGFTSGNGLCSNPGETRNYAERLYLDEAKKLGASAVFFRRFFKNTSATTENPEAPVSSEPVVYIFEKPESFFNSPEHKKLHAALWSAGKAEVYIILTSTRIDIINARKPAKRVSDHELIIDGEDDSIVLAGKAISEFDDHRFSAHLFGSGTFWEQSGLAKKVDGNSNPHIFLLDYLMEARKKISSSQELDLDASVVDKLLIVCILVKFLEEIKDDEGKHTLKAIYQEYKIDSFAEALERGLCFNVLENLANEFNGKIFDTFSESEKRKIEKTDLSLIAQFLLANIDLDTQQYFIWEQYNFEHLPAEVISAIYENFIQSEAQRKLGQPEKGVVYTPIHLVNLLVDEMMPLDKPELFLNGSFKILDPACGSGVFLVAAYKRLLQWWTINNYRRHGEIVYPNKEIAQKILEDNIFGVDVQETAILVSIFGLTTALLDKLSPKEIWNNLKFKDLTEKNIQKNNFFTWAETVEDKNEKYDLVIGNPPFNPPSGSSKKTAVSDDLLALFGIKSKDIPNNNLALKFFEGALFFGKKVCMILPANVILYNKATTAQSYRARIFTDFTVEKIFDFTHLRRGLFHKAADTPVVAFLVNKQPSHNQPIEHVVVKREFSSENKIRFEIDYYDHHLVKWTWAIDENRQFIWKTDLLGGGRLFHLIYKLSILQTLKDFIEAQPGWKEIRGFEGGNKIILENKDVIVGIEENNQPNIRKNVVVKTDNLKDAFMYKPPFMIVEQVLGKNNLPISFIPKNNNITNNSHLYYNRDFIGISVPEKDESILKDIYNLIRFKESENQLNYQLFVLATSSNCLVLHETATRQGDVLSIPLPNNISDLELSEAEKIIQDDVLKYYIHLGKAISENSAGRALHEPVTDSELQAFGQVYCDTLNTIYAKDDKSWQMGQVLQTPMFISFQFGYGKDGGLEQEILTASDKELITLLEDKASNSGALHKKILRFYKHENGYDCVFLIKPHTRRYWLKSIALRDADDTFMDLRKAGY